MTDIEMKRRKAICEVAHVDEIDDVSDGFHTFRQLYYQRMILFAAIVKQNKDRAWKSLRHEDGELCFGGGWFIVGIDTPEGSYTYHYENKYWDMFDCVDLPRAKHWDGHTENDAETRLMSLPSAQPECEDAVSRFEVLRLIDYSSHDLNDAVDNRYMQNEIKQLPSVTPKQPGWIPVTERLPKPKEYVNGVRKHYLVQNEYGDMMVCSWDGCFWTQMYRTTHVKDKVAAWMPLPTPYWEGGQNDGKN